MKYFFWYSDENEQLKKERDISFEQIVIQIEAELLHNILEHPNQQKYKNQKIFLSKTFNDKVIDNNNIM